MRSTFPGCRRNSGRGACGRPAGKPTATCSSRQMASGAWQSAAGSARPRPSAPAARSARTAPPTPSATTSATASGAASPSTSAKLIWRDLSPVRQRPGRGRRPRVLSPLRGAVRSHADDPAIGGGAAGLGVQSARTLGERTKDRGRGLLDRGPAPRSLAEGRSRRPTRKTG
jgi:hypothetical protein